MKQIGETLQDQSLTAYEDLGGTVKLPAKKTPTPSGGSGTAVMTATMTHRPEPEEVRDILFKLSTIKPWLIKPEDQRAVKSALSALDWATIPANNDEAIFYLTRLLAHFPRRDISQDAVVISDLAADMVDAGASLVALAATCDSVRRAGTRKNPWLPPSGEILQDATERTKTYKRHADALRNPRVAISPTITREVNISTWTGVPWGKMSEATKSDLWAFLEGLSYENASMYCRVLGYDYSEIQDWARKETVTPDLSKGE